MSKTRSQELQIALGYAFQADIATSYAGTKMLAFTKINAATLAANPVLEDDAAEYGKGHEFPTANFITSWSSAVALEKYLSSVMGAWAACFGLGKVVKTGTTPNFIYTCTPLMASAGDSTELPYFPFVEQIRPGANVVLDRMAVGMVLNDFMISVGFGPGRANSKITCNLLGSGKLTEPSAITIPALFAEKLLPSASVALTVSGVNYVSSANIVSLETGWNNNVNHDEGFFPGSGFQSAGDGTTGAIRGREEYGARAGTMKFVARYDKNSLELVKLKAQTAGTAVLSLTYDANNSLEITWHQCRFKTTDIGESNGTLTVAVDCAPQYHATNGIVTMVAKCNQDGICQAAA